jgi:hypothetical protein
VDTRQNSFPSGFGAPTMTPYETRWFAVANNSLCPIPYFVGANPAAYSLNVTAIPKTTLGFLSIWPAGAKEPNVSTLNVYAPGTTVANAAIVPAGANGAISVFVTDQTDLILDINGYFGPPTLGAGLNFYPAAPCRIADTRVNSFPANLGPPSMGALTQRSFPIAQSNCGIPPAAGAYSLNFTALPQAPQIGIYTVWPTGLPLPNVSLMNSYNGSVVSNAAIVTSGTGGAISIFVTDPVDTLFDINGYFGP